MNKKVLYVDMDNVLVDFVSAFPRLSADVLGQYENDKDEIPGIFSLMDPYPGALEAFTLLSQHFDAYILSTAPWKNPSAWSDKLLWIQRHLGDYAHKRLILSHNKHLNCGDFLVDDRHANGADRFQGEHIHFGSERFPDWSSVTEYLMNRISSV